MNQAILFNDDLMWCQDTLQTKVTAQSAGILIQVFVSMGYLQRLGLGSTEPAAVLAFCHQVQFDIEEDAQQLIEQEQLNEKNQLFLL